MRDEGRDVDEVAGAGLGDELELVAPVLALGWMTTVPAQSFSAPARAWVMAAARFMPGVCAVLMSSSLERTTRTPVYFHFGSGFSLILSRRLVGFDAQRPDQLALV